VRINTKAKMKKTAHTTDHAGVEPMRADDVGGDFLLGLALQLRQQQGERVRVARKKLNLTIEDLARQTVMHPNTVGRIERGENEATIEQLLRIAHALDVLPAQLMHFHNAHRTAGALDDDEFALIDLLDVKASAGDGAVNGGAEILGRFAFKRSWLQRRGVKPTAARIIRARGNSMADRINDGDILLVNTAMNHLEQDGVYVIELDGLDYVKLVQRDFATGGVQIISYNPAFRPQHLTAEQTGELRISGRVVWHGGEL
jgi:phage repressor protein C with HTH and peptisase S24 domain